MLHKKVWIFGAPYAGKTTTACQAPNHLVLSSDGNAQYVTNSYEVFTDKVTKSGRIVNRTYAWELFEDKVTQLEAECPYDTLILDLVEDFYEMCRQYMYKELKITHESDDNLRAWDKIRGRFLSTMRRFTNLPCDIILISHEDTSKDITRRNGDNVTAIKPNIQLKIANKLAGMVAITGRAVVENDRYKFEIDTNDVTFGGGRGGIKNVVVPLSWEEICNLFDNFGKSPVTTPSVDSKPAANPRRRV